MKTRPGYFRVNYSIPSKVFNTYVAFTVEDIADVDHARIIERALIDGGCSSVYVTFISKQRGNPKIDLEMNDLPPRYLDAEWTRFKAQWAKTS